MTDRWDAIVFGGGHNGLITATLLAQAGRKTLLCEARENLGGLAAAHEFHPGFRTIGIDHDSSQLRPWLVDKLQLKQHGLELRAESLPVFSPAPAGEGPGLLLHRDPQAAAEELGSDAESYAEFRDFLGRIGPFARKTLDRVPADLSEKRISDLWDLGRTAIGLRLLGRKDMMELFRIGPMCVADWLAEWFEGDRLRALLAAPAVYGGFTGPWSPGTNANLLLYESFATPGAVGDGPALVVALERAARAAGVEIRTGTRVDAIEVDSGRATAVTIAGESLVASAVVAACSPKHALLDLVEPTYLSLRLDNGIRNFRTRGTTAKVHLALTGYPRFAARPELQAAHIRLAEGIDPLEQAFDPIKYRRVGQDLSLDIRVPTVEDPSLAPDGHHVLSIGVHWVPYEVEGGWSEEGRQALRDTVVQRLESYAPGVGSLVAGSEVITPLDLEREHGVSGGQIHHGEHGLDQIFVRPTPECARYATPIEGLYLSGGGSYPGGGITGAPGALAAERILADG